MDSPVCDEPVTGTDFYPTILDLAGIAGMPDQHTDGFTLVPLLEGEPGLSRQEIFWHYPHYHGSAWTPGAALRQGEWKLIEFYETGKTELFNLEDDPGEENDLSEEYPERVTALKQKLHGLQKETGARNRSL